jgi:hypothetical protein
MRNAYPQRYVSETGQVFFDSTDPLVSSAANGRLNVYEYEDGAPHLISGGTSEADSYFLDASPDGRNVFFATTQPLLKADTNAAYNIYDARVEGGFAEAQESAACEGEECRGAAAPPPLFATPPTFGRDEPAAKTGSTKTGAKKKRKRRHRSKRRKNGHRSGRPGPHAGRRHSVSGTSRGGK